MTGHDVKLQQNPSTREISYAHSAQSRSGKAVIRLMENSTGRLRLIQRARGYEADLSGGAGFFDVMAERYGLSLEIIRGTLDLVPRDGSVIFIANHPYGILDGLMLGKVIGQTRGDFKILAHSVFDRSPELAAHMLPISFDAGKDAVALNLATRRKALHALADGGAIGVFPGGTVSTARTLFARPMDPVWRSFTARMIGKSNAQVVPVFFSGRNSHIFQIASHLHATLRVGLLIREFRHRVDTPVQIAIGAPIGRDVLDPLCCDAKAMMDFLRKATYDLSPEPLDASQYGYEFEKHYRA